MQFSATRPGQKNQVVNNLHEICSLDWFLGESWCKAGVEISTWKLTLDQILSSMVRHMTKPIVIKRQFSMEKTKMNQNLDYNLRLMFLWHLMVFKVSQHVGHAFCLCIITCKSLGGKSGLNSKVFQNYSKTTSKAYFFTILRNV